MSWVEKLKPEDDVTVEIIYPAEYVEYCTSTMGRFAKGIACLCKGAVLLGDDETEFLVFDMMVVQVITVEEAMKQFGIELTHEMGVTDSGKRWTYFYADLKGLRKKMESGEIL